MAEENKKTYEEAVQELNALVKKIEDPNASFSDLEADIKKSMELISFCKEQLKGYKDKFDALQKEGEGESK